ncbi:MAG: nucleoside triphosphate pyrophosphohydrolase [Syntrophales bacterium]|nr:nucleoside triphosphate pyrophosphohydrolase [Syntrophales bacterium]MCK9527146.1 nucleoside triphosphate pyrophosphohydrolase [Syntrophales bacterium]MDX9921729.1 nucleoside triphosphate pyrophosphohydrolase [Syntrophales bacterium]
MTTSRTLMAFERIQGIMARLRSPEGCLWDRRQTMADLGGYLMDEACEVLDAIDEGSPDHLKEELGDLFFQIIFIARIAEEEGAFDMADVMVGIGDKMIRRHPHVFDSLKADTVSAIRENWEAIKRREGRGRGDRESFFESVPRSLPPLRRALKITDKAARVGFDWSDRDGVIDTIREELDELGASLSDRDARGIEEELGDLLFSLVNLCRHARVDPDRALRGSIRKFEDRFSFIVDRLARENKTPETATMDDMERLWKLSKENGILGDIP